MMRSPSVTQMWRTVVNYQKSPKSVTQNGRTVKNQSVRTVVKMIVSIWAGAKHMKIVLMLAGVWVTSMIVRIMALIVKNMSVIQSMMTVNAYF